MTGRTGVCVCKAWWDTSDAKYCMPVAGDYANHLQALRRFQAFKESNCGSFWTEAECLRVWGSAAKKLKLALDCETQQLSGGPYLPPDECHLNNDERFLDHCASLLSVQNAAPRSDCGRASSCFQHTASLANTVFLCRTVLGSLGLLWILS